MDIRKLTKADAPLFRDIRLESLQNDADAFASSYAEESLDDEDCFAERIEGGNVFGCFANGELVAISGYYQDKRMKSAHVAYIWGVYVRPNFRGQSISKKLMKVIFDDFSDEIEQVRLGVQKDKVSAVKLYEGMGFQEFGFEKAILKIDGQYYDVVLMVKFLK